MVATNLLISQKSHLQARQRTDISFIKSSDEDKGLIESKADPVDWLLTVS